MRLKRGFYMHLPDYKEARSRTKKEYRRIDFKQDKTISN